MEGINFFELSEKIQLQRHFTVAKNSKFEHTNFWTMFSVREDLG